MNDLHPMKVEEAQIQGVYEYALDISVPYGDYTVSVFTKEMEGQQANGDESPLEPLGEKYLPYFRDYCIPQPVSKEQQQELDNQEEKDNKEKEREARQAQKELEQRKAKQKAEA